MMLFTLQILKVPEHLHIQTHDVQIALLCSVLYFTPFFCCYSCVCFVEFFGRRPADGSYPEEQDYNNVI